MLRKVFSTLFSTTGAGIIKCRYVFAHVSQGDICGG